jgi:hypothetical protein
MSTHRRRAIVASGIVAILALAGVVALVVTTGQASSSLQPPSVAPAVTTQFPIPPRGSVVYARADQTDVLALAVLPRAHGISLRASVVGQQGRGVRGLHVSFTASDRREAHTRTASACGAGCYGASFTLQSRPLAVRVLVRRPSRATTWNVRLPRTWPPADASAIVARATRVWANLRSLSYVDRLSSDGTHVLVSHWQIVAPDRVAYQIERGSRAVIVGHHRWDRPQGGQWKKSSALRLRQPKPFWVSATDAHVVASGSIGSRSVWRVSFFDPRTPGWFLVSIDKQNARTLDVRMLAAAHFMHDTYGPFNAPMKIIPPAS